MMDNSHEKPLEEFLNKCMEDEQEIDDEDSDEE